MDVIGEVMEGVMNVVEEGDVKEEVCGGGQEEGGD